MFNYVALYIIEAAIFIIACITETIIFKIKNKEGIIKWVGISSIIFVVLFITTFLFEKPQMKISELENVEVKSALNISAPETFFHFQDVTDKVKISNNVSLDKLGEYEVTFEVDTLFGPYTQSAKVKVVDTTPPEINLQGDEQFKLSYKGQYVEPGYTATDLYNGDLTEKVVVTSEQLNDSEYNIKYEVQDSSGNKIEKIRHITVIDDIAPQITLNGNANMYLNINEVYEEKGAKAVDEIDGDLTENIKIEGSVNTSQEGHYTITYTVTDTKGNQAKKNRVITVSAAPEVVAHDGTSGNTGVIYLTFDDGPSNSSTPRILDILKEKDVKATFFILNYDETGEKLVQREHNEGHTVAIHGYSHVYSEIYQSVDTYMNNITKLQEKIRNSIGYNPTITRFPGGSSNTVSKKYCVGIMTKLCQELVSRGYTYFDWNVDSNDAGNAKTAENVYNNVIKGLSKSKQNVVLMHDFSGNTKTINALANIIDYGKANGYTFSRITEDTPMVTHTPNN